MNLVKLADNYDEAKVKKIAPENIPAGGDPWGDVGRGDGGMGTGPPGLH